MNKFLLFLALITNIGLIRAQYTAIPDACFEYVLVDQGIDSEGIIDGQVLTSDISEITELNISISDVICITDLTGIQDFTALVSLECNHNLLTELNLTGLNELLYLSCGYNQLTAINISDNTKLISIACQENSLTEINTSNNSFLESLVCYDNQISSIDVTNNLLLNTFILTYNNISEIDLSNNNLLETLSIGGTGISNLSVSDCPNLKFLSCPDNGLIELDISQNPLLEYLYCPLNELTNLVLTNNTNLKRVRVYDNNLTQINIRNGSNQNIVEFDATNNPNLTCIFVDDAEYSTVNWLDIDPNATFVETQAECDALSIDELNVDENIMIFPNPANDFLNIQHSDKIKIDIIELYNYLGNVMIRTDKGLMNVSKMNTGIYMLRIITKNNEIISKRIIIKDE